MMSMNGVIYYSVSEIVGYWVQNLLFVMVEQNQTDFR